MFIANPIYDTVFKYLIEDKEITKRLISAIIGEEVLELESRPQEQTTNSPTHFLTVFRVDFKAIIRTKEGKEKKVLIELQKSKKSFDILRFRHYLGSNYNQTDDLNGVKMVLPIIPIYILGFKLSIDKPLLKVGRVYQDISTGDVVDAKDDFIEQLSHDCFVIQVPYLPEKTQSKVERLLSVFNQKWIFDHNAEWLMRYPKEEEALHHDPDLIRMLERLEMAAESEDFKDRVEAERELDEFIADKLREGEISLAQKEIELKLTRKDLDGVKKDLEGTKEELEGTKEVLDGTKKALEGTKEELEGTKEVLDGTKKALEGTKEELEGTKEALDEEKRAREEAEKKAAEALAELERLKKLLDKG